MSLDQEFIFGPLILSYFITWLYGLGVPFIVSKRVCTTPFGKLQAISLSIGLWVLNSLLFAALKDISVKNDIAHRAAQTSGTVWLFVAWLSYYIFIADPVRITVHFRRWINVMTTFFIAAIVMFAVEDVGPKLKGNWVEYEPKSLVPRKLPNASVNLSASRLDNYQGVPLRASKKEIHYINGQPQLFLAKQPINDLVWQSGFTGDEDYPYSYGIEGAFSRLLKKTGFREATKNTPSHEIDFYGISYQ